jgi:hypothetical protein
VKPLLGCLSCLAGIGVLVAAYLGYSTTGNGWWLIGGVCGLIFFLAVSEVVDHQ